MSNKTTKIPKNYSSADVDSYDIAQALNLLVDKINELVDSINKLEDRLEGTRNTVNPPTRNSYHSLKLLRKIKKQKG